MTNELRQLIDIANMPIFGIDVDSIVNEWNEKTAAITGYLREEAMDEPLLTTLIVSKLQKAVEEVMVMPWEVMRNLIMIFDFGPSLVRFVTC